MTEVKLTAIERALAAAKARKATKEAAGLLEEHVVPGVKSSNTAQFPRAPRAERIAKPAKEPKEKKEKIVDPVSAAAKAARVEARENRRAVKTMKDAEDRAAKDARAAARHVLRVSKKESAMTDKQPAHMKKVDRVRSKLNHLSSDAEQLFSEIIAGFGVTAIEDIAEHLMVHARAYKTQHALTQTQLRLGTTVKITGGDRRYLGMTGTVIHSQKLRAKVNVVGVSKPVYIYTGEAVEVIEEQFSMAV